MAAPRSSSGSKMNPATIKIVVAVVALGVAGVLLAVQLGLLGGGTVSVPPDLKAKLDAQAKETAQNPPPVKVPPKNPPVKVAN